MLSTTSASPGTPMDRVEDALAALREGRTVIVVDDESRENEGDLILPAQSATTEQLAFAIRHSTGIICAPMAGQELDRLGIPMMTEHNTDPKRTAFTLSADARTGITTGVSAADRARTVRVLADPGSAPDDLVRPGHVFPLRAREGGILTRRGHTEAAVDLMRLSGNRPVGVLVEVINDDGTMARMPELMKFAEEHGLKIGTITDLIEYRSRTESLLEDMGNSPVQTPWGEFQQHVYVDKLSGETHLALVKGKPTADTETLVRVHEPFSVMDFIQANPRHSWSLPKALERIQQAESGVVILLHRTEDGATLLDRTLPKGANQAYKWDSKSYGIGAQILAGLNVGKLRVLGQPSAFTGLTGFGLEVVGFEEAENK